MSKKQIGIGHNAGPSLEPGHGWRKHCWTRARKETIKKTIPLEIVRIRVNRAKELGLNYPQYASVLLGSGRDIVGFLFTVDGLHLRLRRRLEMPDAVRDKLSAVTGADLLAMSPNGEDAARFRTELNQVSGLKFVSTGTEPRETASWSETKDAIHAVLGPAKLSRKEVVMIGSRDLEADWANAGGLAKFFRRDAFFSNVVNG